MDRRVWEGVRQNLSVEGRKAMQGEDKQNRPEVHVDEDWKQSVAEEKARARQQDQAEAERAVDTAAGAGTRPPLPEPSIQLFMSGLYAQTLVLLGEMENPATGATSTDIQEAAYMVDTIAMLQAKTRGNLTPEEDAYVQNILTDLRMRYVNAARAASADGTEANAQ